MKALVVIFLLCAAFAAGYYVGAGPSNSDLGKLFQQACDKITSAGKTLTGAADAAQSKWLGAEKPAPQPQHDQPLAHAAAPAPAEDIARPAGRTVVVINGKKYLLGVD